MKLDARPLLGVTVALVAAACWGGTASPYDPPSLDDAGVSTDGPSAFDARTVYASGDAGVVELDAGAGQVSYVVPFLSGPISSGLSINVSVGGGISHEVILDTGSEVMVVPASALGSDVQPLSPSQSFSIEYQSSGLIFTGEIEMAVVTIGVPSIYKGGPTTGLPQTTPMPVRVVQSASCDPKFTQCQVPSNLDDIGVLGIGFGREQGGPSTNALLAVSDVAAGTMRAGYVLSTHPPQVTIGVPSDTSSFTSVSLAPDDAGDWLATSLTACASVPSDSFSTCGTLLVDTGIDYCLFALPFGTTAPIVEAGTSVTIASPFDGGAMSDTFAVGGFAANAAPTVSFRTSLNSTPFINSGRRVLAVYDYLVDAKLGVVGFRSAGP